MKGLFLAQLVFEPCLDGGRRRAYTAPVAVGLVKVRQQFFRQRDSNQIFGLFRIAAHQTYYGRVLPAVHHKIMGNVVLGTHGRIFRMPVVVALLQIHGHGVFRSQVPVDVIEGEILELGHKRPPWCKDPLGRCATGFVIYQ